MTRGQPRQKGVGQSPGTEPSVVSPPSGIRVIVVEDVACITHAAEVTGWRPENEVRVVRGYNMSSKTAWTT